MASAGTAPWRGQGLWDVNTLPRSAGGRGAVGGGGLGGAGGGGGGGIGLGSLRIWLTLMVTLAVDWRNSDRTLASTSGFLPPWAVGTSCSSIHEVGCRAVVRLGCGRSP